VQRNHLARKHCRDFLVDLVDVLVGGGEDGPAVCVLRVIPPLRQLPEHLLDEVVDVLRVHGKVVRDANDVWSQLQGEVAGNAVKVIGL